MPKPSAAPSESRARFEKWALGAGYITEERLRNKDGSYFNANAEPMWRCWCAAERDTREQLAQPKIMWGWDIEEIKSAMRQFQSKYPGKLPTEVELAERGKGAQ